MNTDIIITPEESGSLARTAYLALDRLLNDGYIAWDNAKEMTSTRIANVMTEIRKAVDYDDIVNVRVPTKYRYYDRYELNKKNPESRQRIEKLFKYVANKATTQRLLAQINPEWLKLKHDIVT